MKIVAMLAAGALAAGSFAVAPSADAQRYGYRGHHGYHGGYGYRGGPRHYRGGYRYGYRPGPRYYRGGYGGGWRGRGYYGRPRTVCRIHRGYYGPVRRCFRAY